MRRAFTILGIAVLAFTLSTCGKKWKKTTELTFAFQISKGDVDTDFFGFDEGFMVIEEFEFEGMRKRGEDVFFTDKLDDPATVDISNSVTDPPLKYQIPQGTYTHMKVRLTIRAAEHQKQSIRLEGRHWDPYEQCYDPIIFVSDEKFEIEMNCISVNGGSEISISHKNPATGSMIIDLRQWFNFVTQEQLDKGEWELVADEWYFVMNENNNADLYLSATNRLGNEAFVEFE